MLPETADKKGNEKAAFTPRPPTSPKDLVNCTINQNETQTFDKPKLVTRQQASKPRPIPKLTGCPCGHFYDSDCIRHKPLPPVTACMFYRCRSWGLQQIKRYAEELGACPCMFERTTNE